MSATAATSGELVDLELDRLATKIGEEHDATVAAGAAMIEHAIRCGQALIEAKARVPHGEWEAWLLRTFPDRTTKTWRLYMRVARHAAQVRAVGPASLFDAQRMLAGAPVIPHEEELRERARALRAETEWSYQRIADHLGVSHHAVNGWCNPEVIERRRERQGAQSKTARREAGQAARARQMHEHGGALEDAYRKVRLASQTLGEVLQMREGTESSRAAVRLALTKLQQAEDELVRAARADA